MDDKSIQQLAAEIVKHTVLDHWAYWLVLLGLVVVGVFLGAYLGAYATKRGERRALRAARDEILEELRENTRATEKVRSLVSLEEWSHKERRTLRRQKLEEMILAAHRVMEWLDDCRNHQVFEATDYDAPSPLPALSAIQKLYLSELSLEVAAFSVAVHTYRTAIRSIYGELVKARQSVLSEIAKSPIANQPDWRDHYEATAGVGMNEVRKRMVSSLDEPFTKLHAALMRLDDAAAITMNGIISVPGTGVRAT